MEFLSGGYEMREIKFRAWDKKEKKMHYDVQNIYDFMINNGGCFEESFKDVLEYDNYVVMQYTNCYDINGKEIYEGDIVETTRTLNHIIGVVTMIKGCWYIQDGEDSYYRLIPRFGKAENKVIGNIYENKELLK